jgi:hypothetical protein
MAAAILAVALTACSAPPAVVAPVTAAKPTVTATPIATAAPKATITPAPTPTPEPTPVPTPEPTPVPTPKTTPVPPILDTAGRGDKIVKMSAQDSPTYAYITAKSGGNFSVISYSGSEYDDLLVNVIGAYGGSVYVAAGVDRLKVSAGSSWTIEVHPVATAKYWDGSAAFTGKGDYIVNLTASSFGITTITNAGKSNFSVIAYSQEGDYLDLLVNEIGAYSGEVMLPSADPMVLAIHSVGGSWALSAIEQ